MNPHIKVIAPWRYWEFEGRSDLIAYCNQKGIPTTSTVEALLHRSKPHARLL